AQLRDRRMPVGERRDRIRDGRAGGELERFFVACEALAKHGEVEDADLHGAYSTAMDPHVRDLYRRIYAVVRKIPRGAVATYGQVAELAGIPGGARGAGAARKTRRTD